MGKATWPNNLPQPLTSFVGRTVEREQAMAELAKTRLLAMTGPGGSGKTRLAIEVAAASSESFPDGAWWVDLAPLGGDEKVLAAFCDVLGVRSLPGRSQIQAVADRLAQDSALVVLDNCEHVVDEAADLSEALLRGCPRVAVLATSRVPLGVPGETNWRVPPMSVPGTDELDEIAQADSCALFAERAAKSVSGFALDANNAKVVRRICAELDGLPLAVELAAARAGTLSLDQIADGLGDRFRILTRGPRGTLPRHQTLRASVDWSYALLTDDERVLFRRLAVFAGGWSLDAVEAVCSGPGLESGSILNLLAALVDESLVVVELYGRVARYRLLETVRHYAQELLLDSGEEPDLHDQHLAYFVALSEKAGGELRSGGVQGWIDVLSPETANLQGAIRHATKAHAEDALRIGVALTAWWKASGQFAAGRAALSAALAAADESARPLRARALGSCGLLARFDGDPQAATRYLHEALNMATSVGDDWTSALGSTVLAVTHMSRDPAGSRVHAVRGVDGARRVDDPWLLLMALSGLGRSYTLSDDVASAEKVFAEADTLRDAIGIEVVAHTAFGLGWCAFARGDFEGCGELSEQAGAAGRELGDPLTEVLAERTLAWMELAQGHFEQAQARMRVAEGRATVYGASLALAGLRTERGRALAAVGRLQEARDLLEVVVEGGADSGWGYCAALLALGDVLRATGDADGSAARANEALDVAKRLGTPSLQSAAEELLARLAIGRADWSEAEPLLHEALARRVTIASPIWWPANLEALALVAAGLESYAEAARLLGASARGRRDLALARWPLQAREIAALELLLEEKLGPEGLAAAIAEGASMTLDEAISWVRRARGTRKRPSSGWESLTPTEVRVVELLAEGLTNPQVAERMFISRGTVKVHLEHIFDKLGVRSRGQLTALAARRAG